MLHQNFKPWPAPTSLHCLSKVKCPSCYNDSNEALFVFLVLEPIKWPTYSIVMLILILYTFSSSSSLWDSVCSLRICLDLYLDDGLRWVSLSSSCSDWTSSCFVILILQEHKVKQILLQSHSSLSRQFSTVVLNSWPQPAATWLTCGVPWQSSSVCLRGPASHESEQMFLWSRCHQGSQPHRTHCCKKQKHSSQPDRQHVLSIQQIWLNYHVAHCGYIRTTAGITSRGQMQTNTLPHIELWPPLQNVMARGDLHSHLYFVQWQEDYWWACWDWQFQLCSNDTINEWRWCSDIWDILVIFLEKDSSIRLS